MKKETKKAERRKKKGKSAFNAVFFIGEALFIIILLIAVWQIGNYLLDSKKSSSFSENLQSSAIIMEEEGQENEEEKPQIPEAVDFDRLHEISQDAAAWIYAPEGDINYVIAQAEDNDYYLHRLLDGSSASGGTLFMDCGNSADFSDWNTIVYGHHMKNGTMFASLMDYQTPGYYEKNPVMYIYTPGHRYRLDLIAGCTINGDDPLYAVPATKEDRDEILSRVSRISTFISNAEVSAEDRLVTLSTCSYDYDDARYVVIGRLREE